MSKRSLDELLEERRRSVNPALSISYDQPLHIVRGRGSKLYDAAGDEYLDCVNNVCHVGHQNEHVVDALTRQASLLNTNTRYVYEGLSSYSTRLAATLPAPLEVVYLVNSGSEANDLALRIVRQVTGRANVVVLDAAYHGHTGSVIELSPYKLNGKGGRPIPEHVFVAPSPDPYRGLHRGASSGQAYAREVASRAEEAQARGGLAGFFFESIQSCGGQIEPAPGFLESACRAVRERGGLVVADEVQVGFARVGSHWWGFETQGIVPDIVTLGKPIGNGHPLAAVVTTRAIADAFDNGMEYFNTFGGNPVSCAVGHAVLDVIEREDLQSNARTIGGAMLDGFRSLASRHEAIGDVRGRGLFTGIEFVRDRATREPAPELARRVVELALTDRVLLSRDGPDENVLKFKPPMVFDVADTDRLLTTLEKALKLL